MSTDKQRSNSRVMFQKVDKARRLLEEVKEAIHIRNKVDQQLWSGTLAHINAGIIASSCALEYLEQIQLHNKQIEDSKL